MVAAAGRGLPCAEVAATLHCAASTVAQAVRRFRAGGRAALRDGRAGNGQTKVDADVLEALACALQGTPEDAGWCRPTWTRELLCLELRRLGVAEVSVATMGRALRRIGAGRKAPKPFVACPWPDWKRRRRLHALRCLQAHAGPDEVVLFVDEVDIHLNPKVGRDWCLPGERRWVLTPGNNDKRYIAGALEHTTGRLVWVEGRTKASALFIQLLWRLVATYKRARRIHLILDNAAIHSSKKTQAALQQLGGRVKLHFLPPYCPDENRIERVWLDVHANVTRNHRCRTMKELMRRVHAYLAARTRQRTASPNLRRSELPRAA